MNKNIKCKGKYSRKNIKPAVASEAQAAGVVAKDQLLFGHQGVDPADLAGPPENKDLALAHHQASFQGQVAADNRIQPVTENIEGISKEKRKSAP